MPREFAPPPPTTDEIARICRDALGGSPDSIETLRSGAWSRAFGLTTNRGPMVLRFSATGDDFRADEFASRFSGLTLPIPSVYGIGQLGERWWCLSQRMLGYHLDEIDAEHLSVVIPSLAEMLKGMRDVPTGGTSGYGGWDADGNGTFESFADQLLDVAVDTPDERGCGWSARLSPHSHAQAVFDQGILLLEQLVHFIPPLRQLIHQDTLNFNVTVNNNRISGIFDWGCAMWGDALYDLAWFRFWNPWYPQWDTINLPAQLEHLVGAEGDFVTVRTNCYLLHIGLMHIRYNALIENWSAMRDVVGATEKLIQDIHV